MIEGNEGCIVGVIEKYEQPDKSLRYGTAGFRDRFDLPLNYVFVRMGILATVRTLAVDQCVGAVITASHNAEIDNGLKIADADGGMLPPTWEPYAERLANCSGSEFLEQLKSVLSCEKLLSNELRDRKPSIVLMGRDTRPHSSVLAQCLTEGVLVVKGAVRDMGEVTTPLLHFCVLEMNRLGFGPESMFDATKWANHYYQTLSLGFIGLLEGASPANISDHKNTTALTVVLDTSFGVGSLMASQFQTFYNNLIETNAADVPIVIDIRNAARTGRVNDCCGAEHAQKLQTPPAGFDSQADAGKLLCSFDGDADRIVFHAFLSDGKDGSGCERNKWVLIDGDKIAALMSVLLKQELEKTHLLEKFSFGIVQTAYANGASTQFLSSQGLRVLVSKTGVKYLHHKAQELDIGVYFEANGHGTVLFSEAFRNDIKSYDPVIDQPRQNLAYKRIQAMMLLINPAVGDALSDMLFSMAALRILNWSLVDWHNLYHDLPSKQVKVSVPDKSKISCSEDETKVVTPVDMQAALDKAMGSVDNGRCFVRPSGTEDVVRIYAEAGTQNEADALAVATEEIIRKHLG